MYRRCNKIKKTEVIRFKAYRQVDRRSNKNCTGDVTGKIFFFPTGVSKFFHGPLVSKYVVWNPLNELDVMTK